MDTFIFLYFVAGLAFFLAFVIKYARTGRNKATVFGFFLVLIACEFLWPFYTAALIFYILIGISEKY